MWDLMKMLPGRFLKGGSVVKTISYQILFAEFFLQAKHKE